MKSRRSRLKRAFVNASVGLFVLGSLTGCRAQQPWPLWESYTARFLDNQGRVIDHSAGDRTTTEGQAYAMVFSLAANDQSHFAKLVDWTEANLAQGDLTLHLPAWSWGKGSDGGWHVLDEHSAADADLWMAYALCEAGRLWRIDRYSKLGITIATRIAKEEVVLTPHAGTTLLPGPGFHPSDDTWYLNPSYLPPPVITYFARLMPQAPWHSVLESLPVMLRGNGGFAMNWMRDGADGLHPSGPPPDPQSSQPVTAGGGSYDAIRVYLWLGMSDSKTPAVQQSLAQLGGMAAYLRQNVTPPLLVDPTGHVSNPNAPAGFSAAVIPFLHVLGMTAEEKAQSDRLAATRDPQTGLYGHGTEYYDQNLSLFATGWVEGRLRFDSEGRLRTKWKS